MRKSRSRRRPDPALVVALLALFAALGGVAYAAAKLPKNSVGTKQIKNHAVTGAKVKEGSLAAGDFGGKPPQGPPGPQGPAGVNGVGPGTGVFRDATVPILGQGPNALTAIATTPNLPEGVYAITAKTSIAFTGFTTTTCRLLAPSAGGGDVDESFASGNAGFEATLAMQVLHTVPAGTTQSARVSCYKDTAGGTTASQTKIQAVRITSMSNTAVGG